jgi:GNAT superfamily N-acetyltransferase
VTSRRDLKAFLRFPWKVQADDPAWVPPLLIDHKSFFDKAKHPFYEHGSVESFLARSPETGEIVGRISAIQNSAHNRFHEDKVGFFGFFESVNDLETAQALLEAASEYTKNLGLDTLRGPMNFSTNEECGMLIEGFETPPAIMMTHNPPYYNDLLERCGFTKARDLLAYEMREEDITDRLLQLAKKLESRLNVQFRFFDKSDFWGEVNKFRNLYNRIWESNWGFVPMTDKEIDVMAKNLKLIVDPNLILFVTTNDGTPIGFSLALPDLNVLLKKINGRLFPTGLFTLLTGRSRLNRARVLAMGVLPEYRQRGIDAVMYYKTYESGRKAGYNWGEFSWVLEDNKNMNDAALAMGAHPYKKWRIWEKKLG